MEFTDKQLKDFVSNEIGANKEKPMAQIITVNGGAGNYQIAAGGPNKGQRTWSIIDNAGIWYTLYWDGDKPKKGQQFNCNVTERDYQGKTYRSAFIVGPTPEQFAQAENIHKLAEGIGNGGQQSPPVQFPKPPIPPQGHPPTVTPAPSNGKITWDGWAMVAQRAWDAGLIWGMPPPECVAYVNTTLIAFSNGKLELPTEAGPVEPEKRDDDIPW